MLGKSMTQDSLLTCCPSSHPGHARSLDSWVSIQQTKWRLNQGAHSMNLHCHEISNLIFSQSPILYISNICLVGKTRYFPLSEITLWRQNIASCMSAAHLRVAKRWLAGCHNIIIDSARRVCL